MVGAGSGLRPHCKGPRLSITDLSSVPLSARFHVELVPTGSAQQRTIREKNLLLCEAVASLPIYRLNAATGQSGHHFSTLASSIAKARAR